MVWCYGVEVSMSLSQAGDLRFKSQWQRGFTQEMSLPTMYIIVFTCPLAQYDIMTLYLQPSKLYHILV